MIKCIILSYSNISPWHLGVKLEIILFHQIGNYFSCFVNTENCQKRKQNELTLAQRATATGSFK